jgi:secondary thiamine-phosphate synthase enzyme
MRTDGIEPGVRWTPDAWEPSVDRPAVRVAHRSFAVATERHRQVVDVTPRVQDEVTSTGVEDGIAVVNCLHTTCSLLLVDAESVPVQDVLARIDRMVPDDARYRHNDPRYSDCERGNGAAHLRAALLGHGVVIGVEAGRLRLGGSESLLLVEWDGPRRRGIDLQIIGH